MPLGDSGAMAVLLLPGDGTAAHGLRRGVFLAVSDGPLILELLCPVACCDDEIFDHGLSSLLDWIAILLAVTILDLIRVNP